jgi:hypothetical protein
MKGLGTGKRIIQLFNNPDLDLNMTITMAGVKYFRPGFRAEKPASVTASRRRGSPFSCHDESIARGHPDSVLSLS